MPPRLSTACLILSLAAAGCDGRGHAAAPAKATAPTAGEGGAPRAQDDLGAAEALHLAGQHAQALAAYDALIAKDPDWLRPRYLRWILCVDQNNLAALEKELGFETGVSFHAMQDQAVAQLPPALAKGKDNPRPWLHQVACRYLAAKAAAAGPGDARTEATRRVLLPRDLPMDLRLKLEDTLPDLDRAEAAHLSRRYAAALTRYDALIAKDPAAFRPRYLRWILLVDMGALSILERELDVDAALPFEESLDHARDRLPQEVDAAIRAAGDNPVAWLYEVTLRYYATKPTQVANRGDMDEAVRLARHALTTPDLPERLARDLRHNLVLYLGDTARFDETVAAADDFEKRHGEPAIPLLSRKAQALEALDRQADALAAYRRIEAQLTKAGAPFAELLPHLRGEYACRRDGGDLAAARVVLERIRANTAPPQPARKGCAPDWSGDYAWVELQEVRLLLQERNLAAAATRLAALETDFAGSPGVVFLRATFEHLSGRPQEALAFYRRLEAEETPPNPRTLACRLAAQWDAGSVADRESVRAEFARLCRDMPGHPEWEEFAERQGWPAPQEPEENQANGAPAPLRWAPGEVLSLCYHDLPDQAPRTDPYAVDVEAFTSHLELLKARGFHFVRPGDLVAAHAGQAPLPSPAVLLSFDDAYKTQHDNLLPLLALYGVPVTLGVTTNTVRASEDAPPPPGMAGGPPFMTAAQLAEAGKSPWVDLAGHTHDLHHAIRANPQGNTAPAAVARHWKPAREGVDAGASTGLGAYETDAAYHARIATDLALNTRRLRELTGKTPSAMVWPYGAHTAETDALALGEGAQLLLELGGGTYRPQNFPHVPRLLMFRTMRQADLARDIAQHAETTPPVRGAWLPLDGLVDADPKATAARIDQAVAALARRHPSHVVVDVSSDALGPCHPVGYPAKGGATGGAKSGPDWVSHIARALEIRDLFVILRLTARDRANLDAILKMPAGTDVFLDYPATEAEVAKAKAMRTEGRVLVRLGGPANADRFVCRAADGLAPPKDAAAAQRLARLVFWCDGEHAMREAAALGARHWIGTVPTRFNTAKGFMGRPAADPHWLMWPEAK